MTVQWYVHDILEPHMLPLMQQDNARSHATKVSQDCFRTITTLTWPARAPRAVSNRAYLGSFGMASEVNMELKFIPKFSDLLTVTFFKSFSTLFL
ncbi:uncharacterized protein TNCV_94051 [Trichonephila clavipes]|nr:uncharacterized protein TNCV_94051 [Trichonephila clavipes]